MKKKTLLVLLIVGMGAVILLLANNIWNLCGNIESLNTTFEFLEPHSTTHYKNKEVPIEFYKISLVIYVIIIPIISLLLILGIGGIFVLLLIRLTRYNHLIMTTEEQQTADEQRNQKKNQKREEKILKLTRKIEQLKQPNDS